MNRDPAITRDCPFCGEDTHLSTAATFDRPVIADGATVTNANGAEVTEEVPGVCCLVCDAMAPLDVWNGARAAAEFAILRDFDPVEVVA